MCRPTRPDRVDDPVVRRIQVLRMVVGLAAIAWILVAYRIAADAQAVAWQRFEQAGDAWAVLAATFPVCVGVFIALSRPDRRREYLRRALKPLGALLALGGALGFILLLVFGFLTGGSIRRAPEHPATADYLMILYQFALVIGCIWAIAFIVYGAGLALTHMFRAADIHDVLPPLTATLLAWELSVMDLIQDTYAGAPTGVLVAAVFGGPMSVTAVSLWELRRLRTRHGRTVREALGRTG
ncbi:hypothetical protein AB0O07_17005 [Streptomyces sp. NPDC093085]|uniref:hypothetical protein n=1 Tax=Streptomyces sp. NPDC093085 TaxID=3155068 RepID=UPI003432AD3E